MKNPHRNVFLVWSLAAVVALATGCGDDDGGEGSDGAGNAGTGATGTGGSGGTGNAGGSAGGAGVMPPPSCMDYCEGTVAACAANKPQYIDLPGACEAYCAVLDEGTDMAADGVDVTTQTDTRACRAYHSTAVPMDAELHCPHAGPAGGGQCGDKIESFCAAQAALCAAGNAVYADAAACIADMTDNVTDGGTYDATQVDSNTLNCRIYHLTASAVDPDTHCQHTGGPDADSGDSMACTE